MPNTGKSIEIDSRLTVVRNEGGKKKGVTVNGQRVSFGDDRNVLGLNSEYILKCILEKGELYYM